MTSRRMWDYVLETYLVVQDMVDKHWDIPFRMKLYLHTNHDALDFGSLGKLGMPFGQGTAALTDCIPGFSPGTPNPSYCDVSVDNCVLWMSRYVYAILTKISCKHITKKAERAFFSSLLTLVAKVNLLQDVYKDCPTGFGPDHTDSGVDLLNLQYQCLVAFVNVQLCQ